MSNLAERAMLANLRVRVWNRSKTDFQISHEVAENHQSQVSMGSYTKQLIPRSAFRDILNVWNRSDALYKKMTLPWLDTGWRILSSPTYFKFTEVMRRESAEWERAKEDFVKTYPQHIEDAERRLGTLFDAKEYPSAKEVASRFSFEYRLMPIPTANDFRVMGLTDEQLEKVRYETAETEKDAIKQALADVANRINTVIGHMSERLKSGGTFRDSMIASVNELVEVLPALNITDDPTIADIATEAARLTVFTPEQLRVSPQAADIARQISEDILKKVSVFAA